MSRLPKASGRIVLGIETSCDETAVGIVADDRRVLAERVLSQEALHAPYAGVVPEIAARAHVERLDGLITTALADWGGQLRDLTGVASTAGPGLIGGLVVGLVTAKAIAAATGLAFVAVNHLEAHALTARLSAGLEGPYLLLLVSGGHSQLLAVHAVGRYERLGTTIDDAVGEAFDKVAKMMGLGYPGGPPVEALALGGDPSRFSLPRPLIGQKGCDLSFSGLKTAVRTTLLDLGQEAADTKVRADLCAAFQAAVGDVLIDRTSAASRHLAARHGRSWPIVVAGGVAANQTLRRRLHALGAELGVPVVTPPLRWCADNGVMVAWAGIEQLELGPGDPLDAPALARWPLDPDASPRLGGGIKGPKV